jgi:hypothetical protein
MERMHDLEEIAHGTGADDYDDSSDGEDILAGIVATPSESMDSRSASITVEEHEPAEDEDVEPIPEVPQPAPLPQRDPEKEALAAQDSGPPRYSEPVLSEKTGTTTSQTMRARGVTAPDETPVAKTTGSSAETARSSLFGDRGNPAAAASGTATTEAILDRQRAEQDEISESILRMASDLKASSRAFATSLDQDRDVLGGTADGLDRNERGLDAAAQRMGVLRRMTEGKGWWGRMMLYAWVYGLMVLLCVVVFVLPKLRL